MANLVALLLVGEGRLTAVRGKTRRYHQTSVFDDEFFLSAEFIQRQFGGHGFCRAENSSSGRAGTRPYKKICLKSAV